jgi:hypothetical protein
MGASRPVTGPVAGPVEVSVAGWPIGSGTAAGAVSLAISILTVGSSSRTPPARRKTDHEVLAWGDLAVFRRKGRRE